MNKKHPGFAALALIVLSFSAIADDDPTAACKQAAKLYASDDLAGAVEEAKWCLESLEQIQQTQKADKFSEDVAGWKRGELSQQKAMGFSNIEVQYARDGKTIDVSYTGGGGGGMAAMFSQMGMAAGGAKKIRLGHYTGMVMEEGSENQILIGLKMTPGMITLSSSDATLDEMTEFAGALPLAEIDQ
jgi:hypothetical protein